MENKINRVQAVNFKTPKTQKKKVKEEKEQKTYSVIYYSDIINLLVDYQIPVAKQTIDSLKKNTAYLIPRELETIKK